MFKKFLFALCILLSPAVFANYNDIYVADIQYDWIDKNALAKEAMINEVHDIVFEKPVELKPDLKTLFADRLKDKNHMENYMAASAGYEEFKGNNISAFYYKKMAHLYMYALQDKTDLTKSYYYDAMGNLRYVDFIEGEYPDFPYYSIQYRITGKPVSAIYFVSKDCQYLFKPDGTFEGVWYKHKLYNKKNKVILTRTTY
jgi:hypothetical protein